MEHPQGTQRYRLRTRDILDKPPTTPMARASIAKTVATIRDNIAKVVQETKVMCDICGDPFALSKVIKTPGCQHHICNGCIRFVFMEPIKDTSLMPARCCYGAMLPIHFGLLHISEQEAALYREKFDEWHSPNKLYCPVPTCSAFLPPRLFSKSYAAKVSNAVTASRKSSINLPFRKPAGKTPKLSIYATMPSFDCPKCAIELCTSCKQLHHPGKPCSSPRNQELVTLVEKWGYKLCPACNNGVRRMYGCSHIHCRCGANWCWGCLQPLKKCKELDECTREDYDDDEPEYTTMPLLLPQPQPTMAPPFLPGPSLPDTTQTYPNPVSALRQAPVIRQAESPNVQGLYEAEASSRVYTSFLPATAQTHAVPVNLEPQHQLGRQWDNLDARDAWEGELDFGDEPPEVHEVDAWACQHSFEPVSARSIASKHLKLLECHRCWRHVEPLRGPSRRLRLLGRNIGVKGLSKKACGQAWECNTCWVMYCGACKEEVEAEKEKRDGDEVDPEENVAVADGAAEAVD